MSTKRSLILLIALSLLLFLPGISSVPMMDRDSAHFAQATKQMLETGHYYQIRFQDITRFQKPPGINWLQALSVKLSGQPLSTAWPYRIPSFLGGLLSVLCLFAFVKRLLDKHTAMISAALLASTMLLMIESHLAVIDAQLLFSVMMMQGALWVLYQQAPHGREKKGWVLCFWLAMSYGFVLKGVTPLVGLLTVAALCVSDKSIKPLKMTSPFLGAMLFLISCVWVFYVSDAEGTNYLFKMIEKDLLPKLAGGHESHGQPPLFHLAILPVTFWPASIFLFLGLSYGWIHRREKTTRFLLCWIVPTWIFFEIMPTKLPQYVLPTFPALAILCAQAIVSPKISYQKTYRFLLLGWLCISFAIASSFIVLPMALELTPKAWQVASMLLIAALSVRVFYLGFNGRLRDTLMMTIVLAIVSFSLLYGALLPNLKPLWITEQIKQAIQFNPALKQTISDKNPLVADGYQEPSLAFVLGTKKVRYQSFKRALQQSRASIILIRNTDVMALKQSALKQHRNLQFMNVLRGFNYNKGRWLDLQLVLLESK